MRSGTLHSVIYRRGLRHCLSTAGGQCEGLVHKISNEFRFPRFFYVLVLFRLVVIVFCQGNRWKVSTNITVETIFITKRFYQIDKSKWPPYVKDFVENPNISRLSSYVSKIYFVKFNTEAFPRILFFQEKRGDYVLYIPRVHFKKHEEYDEAIKLQEKQLLKKYHYDDSEVDELECKFKELQAPLTKDKLPLEMRDFEGKRDFSNISTSYVYEMEEWVNHIDSILRDPQKEGQLEMAKKLKKLGVPIDTIIQSTTGISKEEFQNL